MSGSADLGEALAALAEAFDQAELRWYVFGAQAVVAYGPPRLTADLDVTAMLPIEQVEAFTARLQHAGFQPRSRDLGRFVSQTRVLPLVHEASGLPVDIVLAGPGLESDFLDHARRLELAGVEVPVISPEDLLVTKLLAGRDKDLEDARGVLRQQRGRLDLDRTRRFLGLLEQALDRRDLLPELERLVAGSEN